MVGVDEIEFLIARQAVEQWRRLVYFQPIPAYMGDGEIGGEALDPTGEDAQARFFRGFLARFEQSLEGDADAEKRFARVQVAGQRLRSCF